MKNLLFLFLLIVNAAVGQLKMKSTYPVYINYPAYSVKANVLNATEKINVDASRTYYWYSSNNIMCTQGGYDGRILMGAYTSYYLSGNLKESGKFKKGIKSGEWIAWFENGKIKQTQRWRRGFQTGVTDEFNESGQLVLRQHFKKGKLNGKEITFEDDTITGIKIYKNGKEVVKKEKAAKRETGATANKKQKLKRLLQPNKEKKTSEVKKEQTIQKDSKEKTTAPKKEHALKNKIRASFQKKQPDNKTNTDLEKKE